MQSLSIPTRKNDESVMFSRKFVKFVFNVDDQDLKGRLVYDIDTLELVKVWLAEEPAEKGLSLDFDQRRKGTRKDE